MGICSFSGEACARNLNTFKEPVGFVVIAILAGSPRLIRYFSGSSRSGILMATTISSVVCQKMSGQDNPGSSAALLHKVKVIAFATFCSVCLAKLLKGRVSLSFKGALKLGSIQFALAMALQLRSFVWGNGLAHGEPKQLPQGVEGEEEPPGEVEQPPQEVEGEEAFLRELDHLRQEIEGKAFNGKEVCLRELELIQSGFYSFYQKDRLPEHRLQDLRNAVTLLENGQVSVRRKDNVIRVLRLYPIELEVSKLADMTDSDPQKLDELLEKIQVNDKLLVDGQTLFHIITMLGKATWCIPLLAAKGADFNALTDREKNTPLLWAIADGCFEMAKVIIEHSPDEADFNIQGMGHTALHLAISKGYTDLTWQNETVTVSSLELARLLIPKTNLKLTDSKENTPLHIACMRRDAETIQALLGAGADRNARNAAGKKPQDLLDTTYAEASKFLKKAVFAYLLDRDVFNRSKEACRQVFRDT